MDDDAAGAESPGAGATQLTPLELGACLLVLLVPIGASRLLGIGLELRVLLAAFRATSQLLFLGCVMLEPIFGAVSPLPVGGYLVFMLTIAALEAATRSIYHYPGLLRDTLLAVFVGAGAVLAYAVVAVLRTAARPWWSPRFVIPIAGMLIGSSISSTTIGLDRVLTELAERTSALELRLALGAGLHEALRPAVRAAFTAGLTPSLNQLSVAGLVSIPGMMTGQILGGQAPAAAATYQIAILFLINVTTSACLGLGSWLAIRAVSVTRHHRFRTHLLRKRDGPKVDILTALVVNAGALLRRCVRGRGVAEGSPASPRGGAPGGADAEQCGAEPGPALAELVPTARGHNAATPVPAGTRPGGALVGQAGAPAAHAARSSPAASEAPSAASSAGSGWVGSLGAIKMSALMRRAVKPRGAPEDLKRALLPDEEAGPSPPPADTPKGSACAAPAAADGATQQDGAHTGERSGAGASVAIRLHLRALEVARPLVAATAASPRGGAPSKAALLRLPSELSLRPGELMAVTGPSGVGKSRLLRAVAALDAPHSGSFVLELAPRGGGEAEGGAWLVGPSELREPLWRTLVRYLPQNIPPLRSSASALLTDVLSFSALERRRARLARAGAPAAVAAAATLDTAEVVHARLVRLATACGLAAADVDRPLDDLSGGERHRAALALTLSLGPGVVLLDEPTGACDGATAGKVERAVSGACAELGLSVLWVTHDPAQADRIGARALRCRAPAEINGDADV